MFSLMDPSIQFDIVSVFGARNPYNFNIVTQHVDFREASESREDLLEEERGHMLVIVDYFEAVCEEFRNRNPFITEVIELPSEELKRALCGYPWDRPWSLVQESHNSIYKMIFKEENGEYCVFSLNAHPSDT